MCAAPWSRRATSRACCVAAWAHPSRSRPLSAHAAGAVAESGLLLLGLALGGPGPGALALLVGVEAPRPPRGSARCRRTTRAATRSRAAARRRVGPDRLVEQPRHPALSSAVSATGFAPVGCSGSPTVIAIVLPREKSCGWALVFIRWVPHRIAGTSGTPASAAIRAAPVLNSLSSKLREIVASGKIPTISPRRR